ncbi:MAG: hypothetical protein KG012_12640 [Deltaproteobacteria bacterium]|nr:hypothetical protein [Deltaproteobacteria bacterium]
MIDICELAYYLKDQNRRTKYVYAKLAG